LVFTAYGTAPQSRPWRPVRFWEGGPSCPSHPLFGLPSGTVGVNQLGIVNQRVREFGSESLGARSEPVWFGSVTREAILEQRARRLRGRRSGTISSARCQAFGFSRNHIHPSASFPSKRPSNTTPSSAAHSGTARSTRAAKAHGLCLMADLRS